MAASCIFSSAGNYRIRCPSLWSDIYVRDLVEERGWVSNDDYLQGLALFSSAPALLPHNWQIIWGGL